MKLPFSELPEHLLNQLSKVETIALTGLDIYLQYIWFNDKVMIIVESLVPNWSPNENETHSSKFLNPSEDQLKRGAL